MSTEELFQLYIMEEEIKKIVQELELGHSSESLLNMICILDSPYLMASALALTQQKPNYYGFLTVGQT